MSLKKSIGLIVFLLCSCYLFSAVQFYESILNSGTLTKVTPISMVSWGTLDIDYIRLNEIPEGGDGLIRFTIEPTDYVEVSLTKSSNLASRFGFIFKPNNYFTIQFNGEEKDLGALGYTVADEFRVVKCGMAIRYYKNEDLLYEYCITDMTASLVHTTHVTTATDTRLELTFDSNLSDCLDLLMMGAPGETPSFLFSNSSESPTEVEQSDLAKKATPASTPKERHFSKNKIIIANVFQQDGTPVKQFRIRTTNSGKIPEAHAIYDYMEKTYKITFKETTK